LHSFLDERGLVGRKTREGTVKAGATTSITRPV
jgi:hypothetical protein